MTANTMPERPIVQVGKAALLATVLSVRVAEPPALVTCTVDGLTTQVGTFAAVPTLANATLQPRLTPLLKPPIGVSTMVEVADPPTEARLREAGLAEMVTQPMFPRSKTCCGELAALSVTVSAALVA